MPFAPGKSGNPGGRSKVVAEELAKFRKTKDLEALRNRLLEIATNEAYEARDAIAAIKEWHDRAYGKAPQALTGEDGGPIKVDQSAGLLEALKRLAGDKG